MKTSIILFLGFLFGLYIQYRLNLIDLAVFYVKEMKWKAFKGKNKDNLIKLRGTIPFQSKSNEFYDLPSLSNYALTGLLKINKDIPVAVKIDKGKYKLYVKYEFEISEELQTINRLFNQRIFANL